MEVAVSRRIEDRGSRIEGGDAKNLRLEGLVYLGESGLASRATASSRTRFGLHPSSEVELARLEDHLLGLVQVPGAPGRGLVVVFAHRSRSVAGHGWILCAFLFFSFLLRARFDPRRAGASALERSRPRCRRGVDVMRRRLGRNEARTAGARRDALGL